MQPPPIRKRTPQTTIGTIIAREAERLPDLEAPTAADVGQMLQRIEAAIGQHLVELVRNTNARKEELAADPSVPPLVRETSVFGYLVGNLGFFAQRWDGLEDLPELATPVVYGPDPAPDETPTERPDR